MFASHVLDAALTRIVADASRLDILTGPPGSYADVAKLSLGHKTVPRLGQPEDCEGGRMVVVAGFDDGAVTGKGKPAYWCLTGQGRLLVCEPLDIRAAVQLVPGIAFELPSIRIRLVAPN